MSKFEEFVQYKHENLMQDIEYTFSESELIDFAIERMLSAIYKDTRDLRFAYDDSRKRFFRLYYYAKDVNILDHETVVLIRLIFNDEELIDTAVQTILSYNYGENNGLQSNADDI